MPLWCEYLSNNKKFIADINPNVILVQETQTDSQIKIKVPGYNVFRADVKRGWGGTAIIVNSNIPIRNFKTSVVGVHSASIECRLDGEWKNFSSFYFPHGKLDETQIKNYFVQNRDTFFGGDTNAIVAVAYRIRHIPHKPLRISAAN